MLCALFASTDLEVEQSGGCCKSQRMWNCRQEAAGQAGKQHPAAELSAPVHHRDVSSPLYTKCTSRDPSEELLKFCGRQRSHRVSSMKVMSLQTERKWKSWSSGAIRTTWSLNPLRNVEMIVDLRRPFEHSVEQHWVYCGHLQVSKIRNLESGPPILTPPRKRPSRGCTSCWQLRKFNLPDGAADHILHLHHAVCSLHFHHCLAWICHQNRTRTVLQREPSCSCAY